mmetsp:Transcript_2473/g.4188  ORF Transcript_2473/g.4188 Transcript_2473/m.4188 type:complete len:169 (-) Transcript_2473:45-551(-)|eukprot:CAMPEP_0119350164 /NCGR_PEP_ID=MMETSP1333-20130426/109920_1 /TAXON_ID=418940 /ORGANISM="Scyphosphaera apsteinii, Strain RCC1455" /LENGTH=168 /DNA_ID=CAMNT_0007362777 /DNA_START=308 /DNA_END=814 /DNA_ORIENTATION=-
MERGQLTKACSSSSTQDQLTHEKVVVIILSMSSIMLQQVAESFADGTNPPVANPIPIERDDGGEMRIPRKKEGLARASRFLKGDRLLRNGRQHPLAYKALCKLHHFACGGALKDRIERRSLQYALTRNHGKIHCASLRDQAFVVDPDAKCTAALPRGHGGESVQHVVV